MTMRRAPIGKAIGGLTPKIAKKAMEAYGFPAAALLTDWANIAGPELAAYTAPEKLRWPVEARFGDAEGDPDRPGATLVLRAEGPRALEAQFHAKLLIERINRHFGFCAVSDVRIMQGPIDRKRAKPAPQRGPAPRISIPVSEAPDDRLRDALERLGGEIASRSGSAGSPFQ